MRIVRRRVMRSAGASAIGKRINLAAAIVLLQAVICRRTNAVQPSYGCSAAAINSLTTSGAYEGQLYATVACSFCG